MNYDLISLQCFLAVADSKSFTKAASKIGRTQSAVSQQIKNLEDVLGKILFKREKGIELTADGETFRAYALQIVSLYQEVSDRFRSPELEGTLRFGLPEDFASVYLSEVLADFSRSHPRILLNVECDLTLNLYERFRRNEFDLVLVKMAATRDFPHGIEVWSEELEWVGMDEADIGKPIPLVVSPTPCVYRERAIAALDSVALKWRLAFTSPSYASTIAAVRAGMGITALPRAMIPHDLRVVGRMVLPKLNEIHVSLLKHREDSHVVNSLEGYVLSRLK